MTTALHQTLSYARLAAPDNPTQSHSYTPNCKSCDRPHPTTDRHCPRRERQVLNKGMGAESPPKMNCMYSNPPVTISRQARQPRPAIHAPPQKNKRVALQEPIRIVSQVKDTLQVPDPLQVADPLPITDKLLVPDSPQVPLLLLRGITAAIGNVRFFPIYTTTLQEGFAEQTC
ncbi:hypothetical protein MRX96_017796 [Rhipicephalus microplus]